MTTPSNKQAWLPDLLYNNGRFLTETALVVDDAGRVEKLVPAGSKPEAIRLKDKALLPGLVNGHSHAFQRVIRGRTEYRSQSADSFWTWRDLMYTAANKLEVDDIYVASRMAFLEMAISGITAVGEFHYLHHSSNGQPYGDRNMLAREVVRAANDVGIRIALLRVAYERAGFQQDRNPLQKRFIEDADTYLANLQSLNSGLKNCSGSWAWTGAAPHSVRAVSLDYLKQVNNFVIEQKLPIHMHVAEQPAEVSACIEEYGRSPVALLETEGLLSDRFTAVHAIHVTAKAIDAVARADSFVCACPTTERNLGDGVIPADGYFEAGVRLSLGTDSQTQIDLLEDARELEYHVRLQRRERNILAPPGSNEHSALAQRLFECATINGAKSIGFGGGGLEPGAPGDFFTVDLNDPSIAGAATENLLATIVFSMSRTAVKDVVVGGQRIVEDGRHSDQEEIVKDFNNLRVNLWK